MNISPTAMDFPIAAPPVPVWDSRDDVSSSDAAASDGLDATAPDSRGRPISFEQMRNREQARIVLAPRRWPR